jgi:integrase
MPSGLIEALGEWKAVSPRTDRSDPVFVTRSGRRQTVTNIDHRIKTAIKAANRKLNELGIEPISEQVSPHSLRRTYASIRAGAGDSPVYIAEQIGHTDFGFTFRVYQRAVKRRDRLEDAYLRAFDSALQWAEIGRIGGRDLLGAEDARLPEESETA